jgi:hypothetical protein
LSENFSVFAEKIIPLTSISEKPQKGRKGREAEAEEGRRSLEKSGLEETDPS